MWPFERWLVSRTVPFVAPEPGGRAPLLRAMLSVAGCCVAAALVAGAASGAVAGTLVVPLLGTIYGGVAGVIVGAGVGAVYTPVVLVVLRARHRPPTSAYAPLLDLVRTFAVLMTLMSVALALVPVAIAANSDVIGVHLLSAVWCAGVAVAVLAVSIRILRDAIVAICRAWTSPWGVGSLTGSGPPLGGRS